MAPTQSLTDATPSFSPRERGKQDRRRRILDQAEALVRQTGHTDFTIAQLAQRALLSGPTPYNLFGSKAGILYALLNRSLDPLMVRERLAVSAGDPVTAVMAAASRGVDIFIEDPDFYRPLYAFLLGVGDAEQRSVFLERSRRYWQRALAPLIDSGQLPAGKTGEQLARFMVLNFMAALELWVHADLDSSQLRAQVLHGTGLALLGFATEPQRAALLRQLHWAQEALPAGFAAAA